MKSKCLIVGIMFLLLLNLIAQSIATVTIERSSISTRNGNTLYVGGDGPGNYTRIQDAIDDSSDGDSIFVFNGAYYENIRITKAIRLIGENRDLTIIDGRGKKDVVFISADNVTITGFTLTNGKWSGIDSYSNSNNITGNIISNNSHYGISIPGFNDSIITSNIIKRKQKIYHKITFAFSMDMLFFIAIADSSLLFTLTPLNLFALDNRSKMGFSYA